MGTSNRMREFSSSEPVSVCMATVEATAQAAGTGTEKLPLPSLNRMKTTPGSVPEDEE
jgi:hypothetical protein